MGMFQQLHGENGMSLFTNTAQSHLFRQALCLFRMTFRRGWLKRVWARLCHNPERLFVLGETLCCNDIQGSYYVGQRAVQIELIRGTENKVDEFDMDFHPVKETSCNRWLNVALERLGGRDLPPVELLEVDGVYYVRDGHHRISVARSLGESYIDAEIVRMHLERRAM
jgi:hypothetical protein